MLTVGDVRKIKRRREVIGAEFCVHCYYFFRALVGLQGYRLASRKFIEVQVKRESKKNRYLREREEPYNSRTT